MPSQVPWDVHYDRSLDHDFLSQFLKGGFASSLTAYARKAQYPLDLQPRKNPKTGGQHMTLYVGLTAVLNVVRKKPGMYALTAHPTFTAGGFGFKSVWQQAADEAEWREQWPAVEDYLEAVIPTATQEHGLTEGAVQAAVSGFDGAERVMVDREVALHFKDTPTKTRIMQALMKDLVATAAGVPRAKVPGARPTKFGGECDLLAVDGSGRLLAVEVKPRDVSSIAWSGLQAMMYARLFRRWLDEPHHPDWRPAREVLIQMLQQRKLLSPGLKGPQAVPSQLTVVPVVALQRGANPAYVERLMNIRDHVAGAGLADPPVEIYEASITGKLKLLQ